jgi:hypothetical protein
MQQIRLGSGLNRPSKSKAAGLSEPRAPPSQRLRAARADRAKQLATKAIEKIIDRGTQPEDRIERKRRLTKGPMEFRDTRVDWPKAKGK